MTSNKWIQQHTKNKQKQNDKYSKIVTTALQAGLAKYMEIT